MMIDDKQENYRVIRNFSAFFGMLFGMMVIIFVIFTTVAINECVGCTIPHWTNPHWFIAIAYTIPIPLVLLSVTTSLWYKANPNDRISIDMTMTFPR